MFLESEVTSFPLVHQATQRLWDAFRPATLASYSRMFKDFLALLVVLDLTWPQVSTLLLLAFMEYLHNSGMSTANITNYMTAIRSMYIMYGMDTACMRD